jgi:hypothetical protein
MYVFAASSLILFSLMDICLSVVSLTMHLDIPAALVSCERFIMANNNVNHKKVYVFLEKDVPAFLWYHIACDIYEEAALKLLDDSLCSKQFSLCYKLAVHRC